MPGVVIGAITGGMESSAMTEPQHGHWLTRMMVLVGVMLVAGIGITVWPYIPWPKASVSRTAPVQAQSNRYRIQAPKASPDTATPLPPSPAKPPATPTPVRPATSKTKTSAIQKKPTPIAPVLAAKRFGVIAFPAARVLDEPDHGDMIGRIAPGQRVEILGERHVPESVVDPVWYRIDFHGSAGWISRLSLTHPPAPDTSQRLPQPQVRKDTGWGLVTAGMINDYRGKILRVDFLDDTECRVQLDKGMSVEDARQTSENIGYYLANATGISPRVVVLMDRLQIAVATSDGGRYIGAIDIRERGVP